jgi:hypothetical protein
MPSPQSALPNDDKEAQDSAYNPGEQRTKELDGSHKSADGLDDLSLAENEGAGWKSSYGGNTSKDRTGFSAANFGAVMKKRGPLGAIITLVLGGGIGVSVFFGPSLLLIQIQEALVGKFDTQNTSMTIRTNKVLANKLADQGTQGECKAIKIACRFSRPSNKLLGNLEKYGVTALDKKGNVIKGKAGAFQTQRPATYVFKGEPIDAKNFNTFLRDSPTFRSAFVKAYNPRYFALSDRIAKSVAGRFGLSKAGGPLDAKSSAETKAAINDSSKGPDTGARAAASAGSEAAEEVIEGLIKKQAVKAFDAVGKSGKGGLTGLIAGVTCLALDGPKMVTSIARSYQMAQLIAYSYNFLKVGSAMKASATDLSPDVTSTTASILTDTVDGKSALDSAGMKNALFNDVIPKDDKSVTRFAPGAAAFLAVGGIAAATGGDVKKDACEVAVNPVTGAAVNAVLVGTGTATFGVTLLAAGINFAGGIVGSQLVSLAAGPIIEASVPLLAPAFGDVLAQLMGDLTQDISGIDAGNALASGASHYFGQTANAGGNVPMSVDDQLAYAGVASSIAAQRAEEDRATLSPFDPTNKNTFVGSMVNKFIPFYASLTSVSGVFSAFTNTTLTTLASSIGGNAYAATDPTAEYTSCPDPSLEKRTEGGSVEKLAASGSCGLYYGIPVEYLNSIDPTENVNLLESTGDIDRETGEPIDTSTVLTEVQDDITLFEQEASGLAAWISLCTDGSTDQAKNCELSPENVKENPMLPHYAVYVIDHRVQKTMDDQDTVEEVDSSNNLDKKALAAKIVAKNKVEYGPNARPNLADIASGKVNGDAGPCGVNINILRIIDAITDKHSIKISSINRQCINSTVGGKSSIESRHYWGNGSALDISVLDGQVVSGRNSAWQKGAAAALPIMSEVGIASGNTSKLGQMPPSRDCDGSAPSMPKGTAGVRDTCNHLHIDVYPGSDPGLKYTPGGW